jgi:protein O-GlcNAc transferase
MTSPSVLQSLNHAVNCLETGEPYCEVDCFHGFTLIGDSLGHPGVSAFAVGNFSDFDPLGPNQRGHSRDLEVFQLQARVLFRRIHDRSRLHRGAKPPTAVDDVELPLTAKP